MYLDETFLDARWARRVENVAALVAYGIGPDGKRQLLDECGRSFPGPFQRAQALTAVAMAVTTIWGQRVYLDMSQLNAADQAKAA